MKRSVLNASELTGGCFTVAFFQTQHASFSVRCGAVAAQRLAVAMDTKEHACLRARAAKQLHGRQYSVPSKCIDHGSRLQDF